MIPKQDIEKVRHDVMDALTKAYEEHVSQFIAFEYDDEKEENLYQIVLNDLKDLGLVEGSSGWKLTPAGYRSQRTEKVPFFFT